MSPTLLALNTRVIFLTLYLKFEQLSMMTLTPELFHTPGTTLGLRSSKLTVFKQKQKKTVSKQSYRCSVEIDFQ